MRSRWFKQIVLMAGLSGVATVPAPAQDQPESGPTIEVRMQTFKRDGGVGMWARGNGAFVPGTPVTWFLTAGSSNPGEMTVCGGGAGETGTLEQKLSRNAFVWEMRVLPAKYENGSETFDLEWARYQADGGGRPSAAGKSTLTLREGERQTIDLVRGAPGSRNCGDESAVVDVAATYKESRQLAGSILQYDIWLTHRQANGESITRRFTSMGPQGAEVSFAFLPLHFAVPQLAPDQAPYDVVTTVQGMVKGRLLPNGRIALTVDTSRRDGLGQRGAGAGGSSGNAGRKLLDVAADEAIEIELPLPGGQSRAPAREGALATPRSAAPQPAPKQAVSLVDGRVVVQHALFFQGQRTSLIVQVKPVRQ
jgi:hypothetical protein